MGVKLIQYKVAQCDVCGKTEQFDSVYSLPNDWNMIEDTYGLIKYKCVCHECSKRIKGYIEEYKSLHYKEAEVGDE